MRAWLLYLVEVGKDVSQEGRGRAVVDFDEEPHDGVAGSGGVCGGEGEQVSQSFALVFQSLYPYDP